MSVEVRHDPRRCQLALAQTSAPVVLDIETTGLRRQDQIVSVGLLVGGIAFILFARSAHSSIRNAPLPQLRQALEPLAREDLVVIGHNIPFDLGFLLREGIRVKGEVRDTLKILRLLDQERGGEREGSSKRPPRRDLRAAGDAPAFLDYKLKHVARQLLGIKMPDFPGSIELAPYDKHATYLACDLVGTMKLYDHLWPQLREIEKGYYRVVVAGQIPILLDMNDLGVRGDPVFINAACQRLEQLMTRLSDEHAKRFGLPLGMSSQQMCDWLFKTLGLPVLKRQMQHHKRPPSLDNKTLQALQKITTDQRAIDSLQKIRDYREATSLLVRLRSLTKHIDRQDGRIHSTFDDRQSSGRISSTYPNLQQLAKAKTICGVEIRSRDALRATEGYELAVFDIAQADIRVLAHDVEDFGQPARKHLDELRASRMIQLATAIAPYMAVLEQQKNPNFIGQVSREPDFDPAMPADLAEDFRQPGDFYSKAASRFLGRQPKDKAERNRYKAIILSIVNGLGAPSLARTLECSEQEGRDFLRAFALAYPKVDAYKRLMYRQIAYTGRTWTFLCRPRTITAHHWLVTEPQVEILVSYRGGDAYWVDAIPLQPHARVLTTYVRKIWNARTGKLIYDAQRGRLTPRPYSIFSSDELQYSLPIRNWGWRSIRRVRARGEEAHYEGLDATARAAFNFICQGGTADISKLMMYCSRPVRVRFGARLLIQIHDELVFEVPKDKADAFLVAMKQELEVAPMKDFKVPIKVEPKRGMSFGSLVAVDTDKLATAAS